MGSFFLQTGLVISRLGQVLEFAARSEHELYFEEPSTGKRLTLKEDTFWAEFQTKRLTVVDAFSTPNVLALPTEPQESQFRNLADLPQKFQDDALRKVTYITKLREAGISRGQTRLIAEQAKMITKEIDDQLGIPGTSTIQRWWRALEKHKYEVYAVVSGHAARKRGSPIDEDSETFLQQHIDDKYAFDERPTVAGAYRGYKSALKTKNVERAAAGLAPLAKVSERTYYARVDERPKHEMMIARFGREYARRHFKMIKGHLPAEHPLDVVEIDHTPLNLYVIDDLSFLPLGRPWATAIKDRYSGVLLGFYISFQATGLDSIFGAIKHSLSSHHLAYDLWPELENPWPAFGLGHYYESDRGGDFRSPRYRSAIVSLGAFYEYCERRTPWLKGSIERFFLTLEQTFFEAMPGRTFSKLELRGDYNPAKDAVVRFSTLIFLLHKWAADFHNVFPNKRKQARPLDLWTDGIELAPPPYPVSTDELNIILGDHHTADLSQEGIRFQWLTYADDSLRELMELVGKGTEVNFVVSREDLGHIHVQHPRTNQYLWIPCTRPEYSSGLSLFQHKYLRKEASIRLERDTAVDMLIDTRACIQATLQAEIAAKDTATKVRLARVAGINSNAVLEGQAKSITDPFKGQLIDCPSEMPSALPPAPLSRMSHDTAGEYDMGHAEFLIDPLFSKGLVQPNLVTMSPAERRASVLAGTPEERAEFARTVSINVDGYRIASKFIENLINRSRRTNRPGGMWLLGDGGVGKSFVLDAIIERHPPYETSEARHCPVLILSFDARPAESDILLSLLLQLGQHPETLSYKSNADLRDILLDALPACSALAILFDESHHLWLSTQAKRVADRTGGRLGDFLKRLYDNSGLTFIFAGTPGLERLIETDGQARTRWPGVLKLEPFTDDAKFRGLLSALDEAIPMPEPAGLATEPLASQLYASTDGNFRLLKSLLADAVLIAASEGAHRLNPAHLAQAHFQTFCTETTPFGSYVPQ